MLIVLLNWLFNGFLFGLICLCLALLLHKNVEPVNWIFLGYGITTILMLIGVSRIGVYLFRLYIGARLPIAREWQKIEPLLCEVTNQARKTQGNIYKANKVNILLINNIIADSAAIGENTILLSDGLLKTASDEELKAVIAHELGHLYNRDSQVLIMLIFGSMPMYIINGLYLIYQGFLNLLQRLASKFGNKGLHLMPFIALIPLIIFLPVIIFNYLASQFLDISLRFMCRRYDYKADKFVKALGYKESLVSYLEIRHILIKPEDGLLKRIFAARAQAIKRIIRLEN